MSREAYDQELSPGGIKIEHFVARSDVARGGLRLMYEWDNLLGACGGCFNGPGGRVLHCDSSREATPLHVKPTTRAPIDPERAFRYHSSGEVSGANDQAQADLRLLNLAAKHLERNRKGVIDRIRRELRKNDSLSAIQRLYRSATVPDGTGRLPPYAFVAAQYLASKIRARGAVVPES